MSARTGVTQSVNSKAIATDMLGQIGCTVLYQVLYVHELFVEFPGP